MNREMDISRTAVEAKTIEVELEIKKIENEIALIGGSITEVERVISNALVSGSNSSTQYWMDKELALRDEKKALRDWLKALHDEKKALCDRFKAQHDEKFFLLKAQHDEKMMMLDMERLKLSQSISLQGNRDAKIELLIEGQNTLVTKIENLLGTKSPTNTPATVAKLAVNALDEEQNCIFQPTEGSSILTEEQAAGILEIKDEHELVKSLTPFLRGLCYPELIFVNSEEFAWLETKGANQKPDGFFAPLWSFQKKELRATVASTRMDESNKHSWYFGVLADFRLRDVVRVADCKVSMTPLGYGEHLIHLEHMHWDSFSPVLGIYFGKSGLMLSRSIRGVLVKRISAKWTDPGSAALVRNFFGCNAVAGRNHYSSTWFGVNKICSSIRYEVLDPLKHGSKKTTAFLGAGGTGRVIEVVSSIAENSSEAPSSIPVALKLVENSPENRTNLCIEFDILRKHRDLCGCRLVVRPIGDNIVEESGLCGFLMEPVGIGHLERHEVKNSKKLLFRVLHSLFALHCHEPPMIHGDARLPNLIRLDEELFWVDFRYSKTESSSHYIVGDKYSDMTTLVKSILGEKVLNEATLQNISEYAKETTPSRVDEIVDAIFARNVDVAS